MIIFLILLIIPIKNSFLLEPWIFKETMIDVLGKTPEKPRNEPKQEHGQHDAVHGKEDVCGKPQNIGNIIR